MSTVLIVLAIVLCLALGAGVVTFFGIGIQKEKAWRQRLQRRRIARRERLRQRGGVAR